MKHPTFRGLLRLAAFLLGLALIVAFANTFCIKTDIYAALTMAEVKARSDIEVAFVGSSIVRDHFNADMISKEIGKTCFALGIPCGMLQGNIASTRELYRECYLRPEGLPGRELAVPVQDPHPHRHRKNQRGV